MKLTMSDADRERLGAPEQLDCSIEVVPLRVAIALETATGLTASAALQMAAARLTPGDGGRYASWPASAIKVRLWLGLYRAGIQVAYDDLDDVDFREFLGVYFIPDDEEDPGKAEGSPSAEPPTPSTSRSSTRRTRSKTSTK